MYSEHLIIFAALSISSFKPRNILEIGTYDGKTALILSKLFPESNITTIDLKDEDPIFIGSYSRDNNVEEFINYRNKLINKATNINFIKSNSLYLTFSNYLKNQDLIWLDGAHGYPIVASDITNCIRLLNNQGILMCDDVWQNIKASDAMYFSIATFETLSAYGNANIINTTFFNKRIGKKYNGNYKYVSFSRLAKNFKVEIK
tara:strand:- start:3559 stop:4167 length:609 start_codon:yes stop_codon:yes gene_type:complete